VEQESKLRVLQTRLEESEGERRVLETLLRETVCDLRTGLDAHAAECLERAKRAPGQHGDGVLRLDTLDAKLRALELKQEKKEGRVRETKLRVHIAEHVAYEERLKDRVGRLEARERELVAKLEAREKELLAKLEAREKELLDKLEALESQAEKAGKPEPNGQLASLERMAAELSVEGSLPS
jgi:hypothetical protein